MEFMNQDKTSWIQFIVFDLCANIRREHYPTFLEQIEG